VLQEFALRNFKALESASFALGRITVLIGPNGTGKSSVLQALTLLKQSLGKKALVTSGGALNLGSYEDVVHGRDKERVLEFRLQAKVPGVGLPRRSAEIALASYEVEFNNEGLLSHRLVLRDPAPIKAAWHRFTGSSLEPGMIRYPTGLSIQLRVSDTIGSAVEIAAYTTEPAERINEAARIRLQEHVATIPKLLTRVYVASQIRGFEAPTYPLQPNPEEDFFAVRGPADQASRVLSTLAYRPELQEAISDFSRRVLGVSMRVRLVPDKMVAAEAYNGWQANLVNEGFGANQLLILLAQLVVAPEDSLLGIEEPEIHLHPKAQAALADVFAELVNAERKQIVLATHSEHVLMGLLTQVARARLKPEDLRVYYFQKDENGVASAELLEVDTRGQLKGGLKGFFEANVEELESYLGALSGRKQR